MTGRDVRELLLAPHLAPEAAAALLAPYGFRDAHLADRNLQALARDPLDRALLAEILEDVLQGVARSADPDGALDRMERFFRASGASAPVLSHLKAAPPAVDVLARTFGASPFLAEILIRHPTWLYWVSDPEVLAHGRRRAEIEGDVAQALAPLPSEERRKDALRLAWRREILHIGVRDLLRLASVEETLGALSALAEALIQKACEVAEAALRVEHGLPPTRPASLERPVRGFTVLGLGKLGGSELNFSSDVDLVFICASDDGRMGRGRSAPARSEYYAALARRVTAVLGDVTSEGYVYRVDLRLRPDGNLGGVAPSLRACQEYYRTRGATWERLALLKAWPVAGDTTLGRRFLAGVRSFTYERPFDAVALEQVREIKRQIDQKIALRDESLRHVKLGVGGIREIELLVQVLQVRFGDARPAIRERNTLRALDRLAAAGLLSRTECVTLVEAYLFLRDVENKLQMVAGTQTHSLPEGPEELRACARRLGYTDGPVADAGQALLNDYRARTESVHGLFREVLEGGRLEVG
jgi:glutamate-ammonia-ligase adenylyltransferase